MTRPWDARPFLRGVYTVGSILNHVKLIFNSNFENDMFTVACAALTVSFIIKGASLFFAGKIIKNKDVYTSLKSLRFFSIQSFLIAILFFNLLIASRYEFFYNIFSLISIFIVAPYTLFFVTFMIFEASRNIIEESEKQWKKTHLTSKNS